MATRESSQTKTRQRGGAFKGEIEEKGLDGKDRKREGYRQPIKKRTESNSKATDGDKDKDWI